MHGVKENKWFQQGADVYIQKLRFVQEYMYKKFGEEYQIKHNNLQTCGL